LVNELLPRFRSDNLWWLPQEVKMADPTKRRAEILKEIIELGRLQKEAIQDAKLRERSPLWDAAYDERARRIAGLASV
jgi:hypothetical protein